MFDDLAAYYHENVVSSFVEYRDICIDGVSGRSRDLRAALNAASALFHLREHLPDGIPSRAQAEILCPDYALLGDVVNASKHKVLKSKTPHGAPLISDAENLGEQLLIIEYEDDAGKYRFIKKTVVVKLSDGSERDLLEILTNVLNFWEQHMLSIGVRSTARTFVSDVGIRPRSRTECESNRLNLEIVQGLRFCRTMRFLRFNSETAIAEPVDLTGYDANFRIYRPGYDVELSMCHEASGKVYKTEIVLTEEECTAFSCMSNDEERQAYINTLPAAQAAFQKLASEAGLTMSGHGERLPDT